MGTQQRLMSLTRASLTAGLAAGAWLVLCGPLAAGEDLPQLKAGLWTFTRTVNGRTVESSKCTSPVEDMKRQNAKLEKSGCTFAPIRKAGSSYTLEATCAMKLPTGASIDSRTTTVMTVDGDGAYRLDVTGTVGGEPTKETLVARWVSHCAR
jgi:hypothetical protein